MKHILPIFIPVSAFVAVMFLFPPDTAYAQADPDTLRPIEEDLERALEDFDPDDEDVDPELLTQFLLDLAANPLNINTAPLGELAALPGMNSRQARALIEYRRTKPFETVDELLEVSGIGPATLGRVRPYVTVGDRAALTRRLLRSPGFWTQRGRFEYISRGQRVLEEQTGYTSPEFEGQSRYAGNPWRYYQRFNYRSSHLSLNLTQLKQPGEPLGGPTDFDFNSWHVGVQDIGWLRRLVIGDFGVWAGQGLVLYTGLGFGKGREVIGAPSRNERGAVPYQSSEQTRFMRGAAITLGRDLQFTAFYSNRPLSATVVEGDSIRFPSATGFHRTPTERARRNNTSLEMYGGRATWNSEFGVIGATAYHAEFDRYIVPATGLHNRFDFEGTTATTVGVDYRLFLGSAELYGEGARSRNGAMGVIAGLEYPVDDFTDIAVVYRNYARDFQSIFGSGFNEAGRFPQNEEGLYVGISRAVTDQLQISGFFDQFRFPAPRFGTRQPTSGYEVLGLAEYRFSRELNVYLMARSKIRENDYLIQDEFGRSVNVLGQDARTSVRSQIEYQAARNLRMRTRFEWVRARDRDGDPETGVMIFQDIRWLPLDYLTVDMRMAVFETESFTSRIFTFENDLLYVFSNTALFGQGQRAYVLVRYSALSNVDFWLKYAATIYEDRQVIGSGLNESVGNTRSQIGLQMRVTF